MQVSQAPTSAPKDNLLGICAAIGEDLGFDPLYLRIALGAGLLWNPLAIVGGYLLAGAIVVAARLMFPDAKPVAAEPPAMSIANPPPGTSLELPLAA